MGCTDAISYKIISQEIPTVKGLLREIFPNWPVFRKEGVSGTGQLQINGFSGKAVDKPEKTGYSIQ